MSERVREISPHKHSGQVVKLYGYELRVLGVPVGEDLPTRCLYAEIVGGEMDGQRAYVDSGWVSRRVNQRNQEAAG